MSSKVFYMFFINIFMIFTLVYFYSYVFTVQKMIKLPKSNRYDKESEDLCKCRPVCKSRRREWKGQIQKSSAELLLERKPIAECFRRWPTKVYPNSPCPLFGRKRITINELGPVHVVRICQAPVDDTVYTPYLRYADIAKKLGAWGAVPEGCPFCICGTCCACDKRDYLLHDAERSLRRRDDMRSFDTRVKDDCHIMRIMYDKP